jgi:hypothetical protein
VSYFIQTPVSHQTYVGNIIFLKKPNLPEGMHVESSPHKKGSPMFTAEQYRAKAIEYSKLVGIANSPNEVREFEKLERSFIELAHNAQWMTDNHDKIVHVTEDATAPPTPDPRARSISQR